MFRRKRSAEDFAEEKGEKPPVLSLADAKSFPGYMISNTASPCTC
jgi:hypothetical protein